jgi:cholesterol 24(S)-hydroxylase
LNITKGNEQTLLSRFIGGPNVLLITGHEWKNQRKVANPAFRRSLPVKLFGKITQELFATMETMDKTVNFSDLMLRWTLEAIGRAGFGMHSSLNITI